MLNIILYAVAVYGIWWIISRLALLAAWLYRRPHTTTVKHYLFFLAAITPFAMEIISSILICLGVAFSFDRNEKRKDGEDLMTDLSRLVQ